jgi:hypothetical protein
LRRGFATSLGQLVSALHLITQHLSWTCTRDERDAILRRGLNENDEKLSGALQANQKAIQAEELYPDARRSYRHHMR